MAKNEIAGILLLLKNSYEGYSWHGPSLMDTLKDFPIEKALNRTGTSHNVIEIIEHMIAWRVFTIERLKGHTEYDVAPEENFKTMTTIDENQWNSSLKKLSKSQETLIKLLEKMPEEKLYEVVGGNRKYNFFFLLHGIIHHDLYHLGQIVLLKK